LITESDVPRILSHLAEADAAGSAAPAPAPVPDTGVDEDPL
jgi:hypothetical protein